MLRLVSTDDAICDDCLKHSFRRMAFFYPFVVSSLLTHRHLSSHRWSADPLWAFHLKMVFNCTKYSSNDTQSCEPCPRLFESVAGRTVMSLSLAIPLFIAVFGKICRHTWADKIHHGDIHSWLRVFSCWFVKWMLGLYPRERKKNWLEYSSYRFCAI